ncbi:hypothetical protein C8R45DRAFT_957644 [Mycena sanguinolenta]|nr:hypothetical protein C8R45DRAFT_957644 [Mycena sanguinolenta]
MKRDLEALRLWVTEQEAGHVAPAAVVQQGEASMNVPDEVQINGDTDDAPALNEHDEANMDLDEPRRLEEDAARALVELAEQFTTQEQVRRLSTTTKESTTEKGNPEQAPGADAEDPLLASDAALAREAVLRKQQEARREQVRIQKEQAHAAAALSILKERQDAAAAAVKGKTAAPQTQVSPPVSNGGDSGNVVAKNTVVPPMQVKPKAKKSKPVSGGVKLGPELTAKVESLPDPPVSTDSSASAEPSPALERAAALGLRVRTKAAAEAPKPADTSAPSAKPKKTRHHSLPPISHVHSESPEPDNNIFAHRTGSDPGNIPIIPEAPPMPFDVSTDVQLMNLRFVLQDEGITWEAISRSRPPLPGVKMEEVEVDLRSSAKEMQANPLPTPPASRAPPAQRPPANPLPITTPTPIPSAAPTAPVPSVPTSRPPPSKKQLPKFNKTKPQTGNTGNNEASTSSAYGTSTQPPVQLRRPEQPPANLPPTTKPSPPAVAAPVPVKAQPRVREDSRSSNAGSGVSTPVQDGNSGRSLNERVSWPRRSPPRVAGYRSRTPDRDDRDRWERDSRDRDRYGGRGPNTYIGLEAERFPRRTPPPFPRTGDRYSPLPPNEYSSWPYARSPRSRSPSPYFRRAQVTPPPPPPPRLDPPARRTFSADHASHRQPAPAPFYSPPQDSPPKGPRHNALRVPSQKRAREDEYNPTFHPQKRFKDDGRDAPAPSSRSFDQEMDRPSLENRLGAPPNPWNGHMNPEYENENRPPRGEGLLSRLSDPARGTPRGRGGPRGRANKTRGRGRGGEVSLVDRLAGGCVRSCSRNNTLMAAVELLI